MNLLSLFDTEKRPLLYKTRDDQLQAIATGSKPMSVFGFLSETMLDDEDYGNLVTAALGLNLIVVHLSWARSPRVPNDDEMDVFVLYSEEHLWRVAAYRALQRTTAGLEWSEATEVLTSKLLGYSEDQITEWLAMIRETRAGPGQTVYIRMTTEQRAMIVSAGQRHFPDGSELQTMTPFFSRSRLRLRRDVSNVDHCAIARVSLRNDFFFLVFGQPSRWSDAEVVSARITQPLASEFNANLVSPILFRSDTGWT